MSDQSSLSNITSEAESHYDDPIKLSDQSFVEVTRSYFLDIQRKKLYFEHCYFSYLTENKRDEPAKFSRSKWHRVDFDDTKKKEYVNHQRGYKCVWEFKPISKNHFRAQELALDIIKTNVESEAFISALKEFKPFELSEEDTIILKELGYLDIFNSLSNTASEFAHAFAKQTMIESTAHLVKRKKFTHYTTKDADSFALEMGSALNNAREMGNTSTRQIADYFNQNNIQSALSGKWSASAVSSLIRRRQRLGLEDKETVENKKKTEKSQGENLFYNNLKGQLDKARSDGYNSTRQISDRFNELGLKTIKGKPWSHVTIHKLIKRLEDENDNNNLSL